jgi:hypothetical protein
MEIIIAFLNFLLAVLTSVGSLWLILILLVTAFFARLWGWWGVIAGHFVVAFLVMCGTKAEYEGGLHVFAFGIFLVLQIVLINTILLPLAIGATMWWSMALDKANRELPDRLSRDVEI